MLQISFFDTRLDAFVQRQAQKSFYYKQAWLHLISRLYGYSVIPLTITNAVGQMSGFLPLCFIESPLIGRRLVSLPFSDHCPLLTGDDANANDLIDQALRLAQEKKVKYLELRTGVNEVLAKRSELVEGDLYVRWHIPLTADMDAMWSGLRRQVQQQIRKSRRLGVQVRTAQCREDMTNYYHLHLRTRSKHGMPAQSQSFFYGLWDTFAPSGEMQLLLAEYQGTIIAGIVLLASGNTMMYPYGASDERYLHLAPNNLLVWEAITWCCTNGYQVLDLGRTARDNEGLMEYKRRWGAVQEPLPYYYYPHMTGLAATSERSRKYHLLTACWRRLPLQVAGPLGGYLYKHLG
jgi:FemAB-related protein (PEP-CTERM system-associated)